MRKCILVPVLIFILVLNLILVIPSPSPEKRGRVLRCYRSAVGNILYTSLNNVSDLLYQVVLSLVSCDPHHILMPSPMPLLFVISLHVLKTKRP